MEELRAKAREQGIDGASSMRKDELVSSLATGSSNNLGSTGIRAWLRGRSLKIFFVSIFLATWIAQLFVEWHVYADERAEHGSKGVFWSANFWETFGQFTSRAAGSP